MLRFDPVVCTCRSLDLLCSVKYKNNLPDIPFDPKFLSYPFDAQRSVDLYMPPLSLYHVKNFEEGGSN